MNLRIAKKIVQDEFDYRSPGTGPWGFHKKSAIAQAQRILRRHRCYFLEFYQHFQGGFFYQGRQKVRISPTSEHVFIKGHALSAEDLENARQSMLAWKP